MNSSSSNPSTERKKVTIHPASGPKKDVEASTKSRSNAGVFKIPQPMEELGETMALDIPDFDAEHPTVLLQSIEAPKQSRPKNELEKQIKQENQNNHWNSELDFELPVPGEKFDQYLIEEELGRGGFGAVYRVKNLNLDRIEALKLILPSSKSTCEDIEKRFYREINIVSRLEHPNIVRLYRSGLFKEQIRWMTMELVSGERLDHYIEKNGVRPFEKTRNIILQLLCGLQEAHRQTIVHRDLKPANIILSQKEGYELQVVILDFGLSKAISSSEDSTVQNLTMLSSNRVYGTPQYMAPEQLNPSAKSIGTWSDVYTAGLILFELLVGKPAFSGAVLDIAYKQMYDPVILPEKFNGTALEEVINMACAKDPKQRYQNAGEFFDALCCINDVTDPPSVLRCQGGHSRNLKSLYLQETPEEKVGRMETMVSLENVKLPPTVSQTKLITAPTMKEKLFPIFFIATIVLFLCVAAIVVLYFLGILQIQTG